MKRSRPPSPPSRTAEVPRDQLRKICGGLGPDNVQSLGPDNVQSLGPDNVQSVVIIAAVG